MDIRIGHTPDADDAFMFYGFASGEVNVPDHTIQHVTLDIQSLNEIARSDDPLEVTAMSAHMYLKLKDRYEVLGVGSSVGRGYGPRLVAHNGFILDDCKNSRIALPGPDTTATLIARKLLPSFEEVQMDFLEIMPAIQKGEVDAGVVIHEAQLTYKDQGVDLILDLASEFQTRFDGLPLPLGLNCVLKKLDPKIRSNVAKAYEKSVEMALTQRQDAINYCMEFSRGADRNLIDEFVGMYVNEDSLLLKDDVIEALDKMNEFTHQMTLPTNSKSLL